MNEWDPMQETEGSCELLRNLLLFGRLLRRAGVPADPERMRQLVEALDYVDIGRRDDVYYTARSMLVSRRADLPLFDRVFAQFWRLHSHDPQPLDVGSVRWRRTPRTRVVAVTPQSQSNDGDDGLLDPDEPDLIGVEAWYSPDEALRRKDFAAMDADELARVQALLQVMRWRIDERRTRRLVSGKQGRTLDLRGTLRSNLRYGGELLELAWRDRRRKPRPLIILADISGSMERYSRLLLLFAHTLTQQWARVESFVFGTRLTRITRELTIRELNLALDEVGRAVVDWSGGTRIGESLKAFNYAWARRVLGGGAVVLLISDGWDRGDPELLRTEMARLQRSCHRLIWLNPLLGSPEYEPLTRGMQAALPYVDDFLPVHNLNSLRDLALHLSKLSERPTRRRFVHE